MSNAVIAQIVVWSLIALVVVAIIAVARRQRDGKRKPGGLQMLGAMMLGFGEPFDPPSRHMAEAKSDKTGEDDESGDPPSTKP